MIRGNTTARAQMSAALASDNAVEIFAVIAKPERREDAMRTVQELRDRGWRVEYPLSSMNIPRQFHTAEARGARLAVLFGDEWPQVAVKDLTSGEQQLIGREQLLERISQALSS